MTSPVRFSYLEADGPIGLAHRGGALGGLENSMAAFDRAVALGFRYLETDVHASADGVLVAFHDERLERVTDGVGAVGDLPWSVVRRARIGGCEPIPRLAEVLDAWPEVRVNVDVKADAAVAPLVALLRTPALRDRVCVASFSDRRLRGVRAALGPRLCTSMGPAEVVRLRLASWARLPPAAVPRIAGCVQVPVRSGPVRVIDRPLLRLAHAAALPVHAWTVNEPAEMRRLLDLGVDGLVSDDLEALQAALAATRGG